MQPALDGPNRQIERLGGQLVALPLQVAKNDRDTEAIGKPVDFLVEYRPRTFEPLRLDERRAFRLGGPALEGTPAPRGRLDLNGQPLGDSVKPGPERVANPEPARFAQEHQECRLEGVLGVVRITKQHGADAKDHGPMPLDQRNKCQLGLVGFAGGELLEQLAVRKVADRAQVDRGCEAVRPRAVAALSPRAVFLSFRHLLSLFISIRQAGLW